LILFNDTHRKPAATEKLTSLRASQNPEISIPLFDLKHWSSGVGHKVSYQQKYQTRP